METTLTAATKGATDDEKEAATSAVHLRSHSRRHRLGNCPHLLASNEAQSQGRTQLRPLVAS